MKSNPKPNDGTWNIGKTIVKIGNNSEDRTFFSNIKNGTSENEYYIVLLFTMKSGTYFRKKIFQVGILVKEANTSEAICSIESKRNSSKSQIEFLRAAGFNLFVKTRTAR